MKLLTHTLFTLFLFSLLASCQSTTPTNTIVAQKSSFGGTSNKIAGEDGFGGTGIIAENGFGGTGIVGTITAFGSIWVNGIEVEYDNQTPIKSSIVKNKVKLKLGQQVSLETKPNRKDAIANNITVYYPIAGKITAVNKQTITVMGETVLTASNTLYDKNISLKTGNYIAINALPNINGGWNATRINHNPEHRSFYQPEPPLDFSREVKRLIIEDTMMHHREMVNFRNMRIQFAPSHMEGFKQMHDLKDMKDSMESMEQHNPHDLKPAFGIFHH